MKTWTVIEVVRWTAGHMSERGIESARLDAELLLSHTLGVGRLDLYTGPDRPLNRTELDAFKERVRQRLAGMSVAHIVGYREFWKHRFGIVEGIFVPRPETEIIVEQVLKLTDGMSDFALSDLCTGSGNIPVSILGERERATAHAVDISARAVAMARKNALDAGIGPDRLTFHHGDAADFLAARPAGFDIITCNPPYIPTSDIAGLPPEVVEHEPVAALDGGPDGLSLIKRLAPLLSSALLPGGYLILEYDGNHQTGKLIEILKRAGFTDCRISRDLAGVERVATATGVS